MPFQPGSANYTQAFGTNPENVEVPHIDVRAPATTDILYPIGKVWVDTVGNSSYTLTSLSTSGNVTTATWVTTGGGSGALASLTGDTGTATPSAGNIKIAGTTNQITTAASGSTVTLSLPAAITTPGSLTTTTSLTATLGNITATNGNLVLGTAGNKIVSTSVGSGTSAGANSFGTVTLATGTATVSTTAVTASSIIMLTRQSPGSTGANPLGMLSVGTIVAGTSFVINALTTANSTTNVASDVSVIGWMIIN